MSTLLFSLGRWSYRHPWRVIVSWLLLLALAGGGVALFAKGLDNSFSIPGTEAEEGLLALERTFPQASGTSAQLIVVAPDGTVIDDEPVASILADAVEELGALDGVLAVTDPFDELISGTVSDDRQAAIVRLQFDGQATDVSDDTLDALNLIADDTRERMPSGSEVAMGGDLFSTSVPALTLIEAVGVLIALFVLIVTFRSFAVAWFPLVSALIGVALAMALVFVATAFATISSTTPLLAIMLGLAVGIDYALFIVARHQDQVRAGVDPEESAARATGTAGSAVVFAGTTVLIALVGLSLANIPFLTVMGIAAAVAVAVAVFVAVTVTPALLGLAKERVTGWPRRERRRSARKTTKGPAERWVTAVTRHPIVTTVVVVAGLAVVAIPAGSLHLALPNAGQQPTSSQARQAYDLTAEHFGPGSNGPLIMTGTIVTSTDPLGLMDDLRAEIERIPGVEEVALATPNETADTGLIQIVPTTAPDDPATADLVRELRAQHDRLLDEYGVDLKVTGFTAVGIDISDRLGGALLPFGLFVVGLSLVLLMIVFRSIWVPVTAAAGYLLSIVASFGIVAAVFEWGWFADALHVARTGPVISFMPIILMGVLFGLAMDYEVFLVSRMREDFVHGGDARAAVRTGFTGAAKVVTAAALIMFSVFVAFVPEGDSNIKPIALGLAVGVFVDAFIVRMALVPAVMQLLGERAWWLPRWLDRILPSFDVEGEGLARERALADWPTPGSTAAVVADGLGVRDEHGTVLFADVALSAEPGEIVLVTGHDDRRPGTALLLTITGRLRPSDGRIKVLGRSLPERGAAVRARTAFVGLADEAHPVRALRRELDAAPDLIAVDGIDRVESRAVRAELAAVLQDAAVRGRRRGRPITVVLAGLDPAVAVDVVPDTTTVDIDLPPVAAVDAGVPSTKELLP